MPEVAVLTLLGGHEPHWLLAKPITLLKIRPGVVVIRPGVVVIRPMDVVHVQQEGRKVPKAGLVTGVKS